MFQAHGGRAIGAEILLVGGVVIQYIATRFSMAASGRSDGSSPGRLALAQWLPIVTTALAAVAAGQPEMALCLVFGSSVAAMALVLGMTMYVAPPANPAPQWRRWALVLPAAILILLAGFRGQLTWYHAVMLLIMGAAFLGVWMERGPEQQSPTISHDVSAAPVPRALIIPAVILAAIGAYAAVRGAGLSAGRMLTPDLLAATILSPLLMLPSLGVGTLLAQQGHGDRAITSLCGTVQLNLCLLLPVVVLIQYALGAAHGQAGPMTFPLITWRVDAVLLVVLSFALLPLAAGRWAPARIEAALLIVVYIAYLFAETALSVRLLG
jgi:Ca2+/Na+ antiporter